MQVVDARHGDVTFEHMLNDIKPEVLENKESDGEDASHLALSMSCPPAVAPECHKEVVSASLTSPPVRALPWLPSDLSAQVAQEKKEAAAKKNLEQQIKQAANQVAKDAAAVAKAEKAAATTAALIAKQTAKLMPRAPQEEIDKVVAMVMAEEEERRSQKKATDGTSEGAQHPIGEPKDRLVSEHFLMYDLACL
jgi:hypothetical protein